MKQLDFTLSLIDKASGPLKGVQSSLTNFAATSRSAFTSIGIGAAGLWGTAQALRGSLGPALEMHKALQSAAARGIDDKALKSISQAATKYSLEYGKSAIDYIQSSANINAAIAGLNSDDLIKVTKTANLAAAAMQSTSSETSAFMSQMFNKFSSEAARLGNAPFADQLAEKMTYLRQSFGVNFSEIQSMMATNYVSQSAVGIDEQLAVLNQLHQGMGWNASYAYNDFVSSAEEGAKKLGLSFTDASGKLISMPDILEKLQGRYGKSLEGNLKAQAELDAAFGGSADVIRHLYGNVDTLQRHITELGGSDGLRRTQEMAAKMADPWDRLLEIFQAVRVALGKSLIPAMESFVDYLADMGATFVRWLTLFPNIARAIGYITSGVLGLSAVGAAANVVMGVSKFILVGLKGVWAALATVVKIYTAAQWLCTTAVVAWTAALRILRGVLLAVRIAAITAAIGINLMSWPILLIIGAIGLLVVAGYYLIKNWEKVWGSILAGWHSVVEGISEFSIIDGLQNMAISVGNIFSNLWDWLRQSFLESYDWIIGKLNKIPGVTIDIAENNHTSPIAQNTLSTGNRLIGVDKGLSKSITNQSKNVTDNSRMIGTVNINSQQPFTPEMLLEWQETTP